MKRLWSLLFSRKITKPFEENEILGNIKCLKRVYKEEYIVIIDSKGKLFGIINIVDLTLIVLIVALIAGGAYRLKTLRKISDEDQKQIMVTVEFEGEKKGLADAIQEGDILYDSIRGTEFGRVIGKTIKPHREVVLHKDGKAEYLEIPGEFDVEVKIESMAVVSDADFLVGKRTIYIGSEIRLKSNIYVFTCKVSNIEE